ncbi:hypothetical protein ACQEVZ_50470 [Dactylosporangium sp. CA-152071]|uniref:hypothetical protein n=1 Tax=Dactylosporangium sp. CA-152071 TaxID=3239933 RepID=UPI003D8FDC0C
MRVIATNKRVKVLVLGIFALLLGGVGTAGAAITTVPAWRAAQGAGVTGTFTLTDPRPCDRWDPPRQRCGWVGDFVSDDGTVVRRDTGLSGGLPPGAKVGDTLPARDTGSPTVIYPLAGAQSWKDDAMTLAISVAIFVLGLVLTRPWCWCWSWWRRLRQLKARGQEPSGASV